MTLKAHLQSLHYTLLHKWYVFQIGRQLGVPFWRRVFHNWSKFTRREWRAYAYHFADYKESQTSTGYFHVPGRSLDFDRAWLQHIHHNPHHWQYWLVFDASSASVRALPIPEVDVREMVADWISAGLARGKPSILDWYEERGPQMVLHEETRELVRHVLDEAAQKNLFPLREQRDD